MRVHLVGVSGTGMGALAALFVEAGHEVSGSDVAFDPPIGPALRGARRPLHAGLRRGAPRRRAAGPRRRGQRDPPRQPGGGGGGAPRRCARASMSGALREHFLARRRPLVVAGTHGKTTTSAMCAWLLARGGFEPGWFIGGIPKGLGARRRDRLDARAPGSRPRAVRRRGGRVRRGLLAQAAQVPRLRRRRARTTSPS